LLHFIHSKYPDHKQHLFLHWSRLAVVSKMASPDQMDWTDQPLVQQSAPPPGPQSGFQSLQNVPETTASQQPGASTLPLLRPQPNHSIFDNADYLGNTAYRTSTPMSRPTTARSNINRRSRRTKFAAARLPSSRPQRSEPLASDIVSNSKFAGVNPNSPSRRIILPPVRPSRRLSNPRYTPYRHSPGVSQRGNAGLSRYISTQQPSTPISQEMLESPTVTPRKRFVEEIQETPAAEPEVRRDYFQELVQLEREKSPTNVSSPDSSRIRRLGLTQTYSMTPRNPLTLQCIQLILNLEWRMLTRLYRVAGPLPHRIPHRRHHRHPHRHHVLYRSHRLRALNSLVPIRSLNDLKHV
jgi:hypothetical protein